MAVGQLHRRLGPLPSALVLFSTIYQRVQAVCCFGLMLNSILVVLTKLLTNFVHTQLGNSKQMPFTQFTLSNINQMQQGHTLMTTVLKL